MDTILTASGIEAWVRGTRRLVKEWDTALIDTVEVTTFNMFEGSSQAALMQAGGTGLTTTAQTILGTSMSKSGIFSEPDFVATQLALEVPPYGVYNGTPANDLVVTDITDYNKIQARAFFKLFFDETLCDRGQYLDFPAGRGLWVPTSTAAVTPVTRGVSNGIPMADARNLLATPHRCTAATKTKLEVSFPKGALNTLTADCTLRATIYGVTGL